ncbi:MAG TPA: HNH endonuclease [Candidatus Tectomicrobia bacterium]
MQARTVFHPVNGTYDGYQTICKKCNKEKSNGFYAVNCEEQKAKRKITYAEDPEKQKQANQAWRKEHPEEVREQSHRASVKRRALLMHCPLIEDFSRKDVFIRDKWICQLCYKPVKKTLRFPHPKSPSLDHVIPVMQGGNHSYQNCVLTHLGCNAAKAARDVQQQQRLF